MENTWLKNNNLLYIEIRIKLKEDEKIRLIEKNIYAQLKELQSESNSNVALSSK